MSWGWAEDSQCEIMDCSNITSQQYVERVNNEFVKLGLLGTTITVSSGDAGAPGRTSEDCNVSRPVNPVFPGSSPYVLSIGATYITLDNSSQRFETNICQNHSCVEGNEEQTISQDNVGWTAGGGFDIYHNETPKWQSKQVTRYLKSGVKLPKKFNRNGRAYPDVSAVGHSCPTYIDGGLDKIDGTSCSSPIVAGLLATINDFLWERNRTKLGFANPLLYMVSENCDNCFNDIVDGHNWCTEQGCCPAHTFGYQASKGYDPVTGLGTLNVGNILHYLSEHL
jgi:tripeptidyl-peptidase-1